MTEPTLDTLTRRLESAGTASYPHPLGEKR